MANKSAWAGGLLNSGGGFVNGFNSADINVTGGMANGASSLSSLLFQNDTSMDQFMDLDFVGAFGSAQTLTPGACLSFWLGIAHASGTAFGDGKLTAGATPAAVTPILNPIGAISFQVGSTTALLGSLTGILIPPRSFSLIMQNNTGFALAATGNTLSMSSYRIDTNA